MDDTEFVGTLKKQDRCPVKEGDLAIMSRLGFVK